MRGLRPLPMACPNGTIKVTSEFYETEDGKKKKRLVKYEYDLGSCMFCQLCTRACPHNAIAFDQSYENAVFDRTKLVRVLNHEGSKVQENKRDKGLPCRYKCCTASFTPLFGFDKWLRKNEMQ